MSLSTKNLPTGNGLSKSILPGNLMAKINRIELRIPSYDQTAYDVILQLEGVDLGDGFEGFWIDKDDQSKGRFAGQTGSVKISPFAFKDSEYEGRQYYRDQSILVALNNLAKALGKTTELGDLEAATIEEFLAKANPILADGETYLNWCIAGNEEINAEGYPKYYLNLPKASKDGVPYESTEVAIDKSRLLKFSPDVHIRKKKGAAQVAGFSAQGATAPAAATADFDMD